ncbi:hypothetical protein FisN_1Hu508 [Fistulifera solaris]|jgi:hypothetical protein|uniref:Uncharacterized protein n=1 Tax=Fistulifera solaris TaxID=1519565 RepID=A0A1Z5JJW5_FISSO|nr:hypothetical protein FisN_1Hu508 [Fistulifera solaris]|eukprot:GAX14310.1 hypothetical protein FisN_1Hu508 [Fistulifera solaris]
MKKLIKTLVGYLFLYCGDSLTNRSTDRRLPKSHAFDHTLNQASVYVPTDRRSWLQTVIYTSGGILANTLMATPASATDPRTALIKPIADARKVLQNLLDKWETSVVDCTYADVPRDLLEQKNKELLLEKASTYALFDKSVSVITCKTSNKKIRDYLGRTGVGPLVGLDKNLRKAIELLDDPDRLDEFIQASENLQQALSKADSLSYTAGVADFTAVNNFDKDNVNRVLESNNQLAETKRAIADAVKYLDQILSILEV